jgi:spoIIIJ-associated protein
MSDVRDIATEEVTDPSVVDSAVDGVVDEREATTEAEATPGTSDQGSEHGSSEQSNSDDGTLEDEGDIAADYFEELLDICDLDGDIDIDARAGRAYVSVNSSEDSNLRLLSNPDTVQALQELTRLAVQTKTGGFSRLILDVGGSRQIREAELARLVSSAIDRIEVGGESSVSLAPMSSYERKVVHDLVAERGFVSESEGEGRDRHTVVTAPRS